MDLSKFPEEVFAVVIEQLVLMIGNRKAVRLRTVNRRFDAAILHAVFVQQVVSFLDPRDVQTIRWGLSPPAMGRLLLATSKTHPERNNVLSALARVIEILDDMGSDVEEAQQRRNHEVISEALAQHWSTMWDALEFVEEGGGKCYKSRPSFQDLFCASISLGNLRLIERLLEDNSCPPDSVVNEHSPYFGLPLSIASAWGHTEVVKYLLDNGADPHVPSVLSRSTTRNQHTVKFIDGCDNDFFRNIYRSSHGTPLRAAALAGHKDLVNLLMKPEYLPADKDVDYEAWDFNLHNDDEHFERLKILRVAARGGHEDILMPLSEVFGMPLEQNFSILLLEAAYHGRETVARTLLQKGANPNSTISGYLRPVPSPLQLAAGQGHPAIVRLLLEYGADIFCTTGNGDCAVRIAALRGHEEAVFILHAHGGNIYTAFRAAIDGSQNHLLKRLLLAPRLDLNKRLHPRTSETEGTAALIVAVWKGLAPVVRTLVEAGVAPNDDDLERDAVFQAWKMGRFHVYELLLRMGAQDKAIPDSEEYPLYEGNIIVGGIRVDERTCEWVGRY